MKKYIVRPGGIVEETSGLFEWSDWYEKSMHLPFEDGGGRVALTELDNGKYVSTVFLSVDHGWGEGSVPILFETMIYNCHTGNFARYQERYATVDAARIGHWEAVRLASGEVDDTDGNTNC